MNIYSHREDFIEQRYEPKIFSNILQILSESMNDRSSIIDSNPTFHQSDLWSVPPASDSCLHSCCGWPRVRSPGNSQHTQSKRRQTYNIKATMSNTCKRLIFHAYYWIIIRPFENLDTLMHLWHHNNDITYLLVFFIIFILNLSFQSFQ